VATVVLGGEVHTYQTQRHDRDRSSVLEGVEDALNGVCARYGASVRAIVVSLPGTVSGTRLVQAPNLGWQDVELSMLAPRETASVPFLAGNDATFSAIADARRSFPALGGWPVSSGTCHSARRPCAVDAAPTDAGTPPWTARRLRVISASRFRPMR
jgi:hypothetical protein